MSQHQKLTQRIRSKPKDFTWDELKRLMVGFGYQEKTGPGSRRKFIHPKGAMISLHKPHPGNELKQYQVDDVLEHLTQENLI